MLKFQKIMKIKILCIATTISLLLLPAIGKSQLKGKVVEKSGGKIIPGASLFINASSYGTISDNNGSFILKDFPDLPFDLTITAMGYTTESIHIKEKSKEDIIITLEPKITTLQEITITNSEKYGWKKYGQKFLEAFIGYSPFAGNCEILNKEVIEFRYNKSSTILYAVAKSPIVIKNNALGYTITYWLEDFEFNHYANTVFYKGYSQFEEIIPKNKKQKNKWVNNRLTAFEGSCMHFIKCLHNKNLVPQGFELRAMKKIQLKEIYDQAPQKKDTIVYNNYGIEELRKKYSISGGAGFAKKIIKQIKDWKLAATGRNLKLILTNAITGMEESYTVIEDPLDKERIIITQHMIDATLQEKSNNGTVAVLGAQIKEDALLKQSDSATTVLTFKDYLHITYTKELEEENYLTRQGPFKKIQPGFQKSILSLKDTENILIFANGNFEDPYHLVLEGYWSYEKLDKLLPLDYIPGK